MSVFFPVEQAKMMTKKERIKEDEERDYAVFIVLHMNVFLWHI